MAWHGIEKEKTPSHLSPFHTHPVAPSERQPPSLPTYLPTYPPTTTDRPTRPEPCVPLANHRPITNPHASLRAEVARPPSSSYSSSLLRPVVRGGRGSLSRSPSSSSSRRRGRGRSPTPTYRPVSGMEELSSSGRGGGWSWRRG